MVQVYFVLYIEIYYYIFKYSKKHTQFLLAWFNGPLKMYTSDTYFGGQTVWTQRQTDLCLHFLLQNHFKLSTDIAADDL